VGKKAQVSVNIINGGTLPQPYDIVAVHYTPTTPERRAAAMVWAGANTEQLKSGQAVGQTITANGKALTDARSQLLPARVFLTNPNAPAPTPASAPNK
jgi:hypothetical protein